MGTGIDFTIPAVRWCVECGFFLVGAALGSFLNVCFWRIPRGESVVTTPSHCTTCQHKIAWYDNLPIASYLILRGKCRHCHTPYSPRYFFVELATATLFALFAATGIFFDWTPRFFLIPGCAALYFAIAIAWFDFCYQVIPGDVTKTAWIAGILLAGIFPETRQTCDRLWAMLLSAAAGIGFYLALAIFAAIGKRLARREVFGGGDVKATAAIAALLSYQNTFFILFFAALAGMLSGGVCATFHRKKWYDQTVAFGVDLAVGIALWCFGGKLIAKWIAFCVLR